MDEKGKYRFIKLILTLFVIVPVILLVAYLSLFGQFNDGHGGVYQEVRQCGNVRSYMWYLDASYDAYGEYPKEIPPPTLNGLKKIGDTEILFYMRDLDYMNLNKYSYVSSGDSFEFSFNAPNGKQFTVTSTEEGLNLCRTGSKIKCLDDDWACNFWYFKRPW